MAFKFKLKVQIYSWLLINKFIPLITSSLRLLQIIRFDSLVATGLERKCDIKTYVEKVEARIREIN